MSQLVPAHCLLLVLALDMSALVLVETRQTWSSAPQPYAWWCNICGKKCNQRPSEIANRRVKRGTIVAPSISISRESRSIYILGVVTNHLSLFTRHNHSHEPHIIPAC
jgi:hypothetical protein